MIPLRSLLEPAGSGQVFLRHPETTIYRCFLSDLTDFIAFCRAGPSLQHHLTQAVPQIKDLKQEINPAKADCRYRAPLVPRLAQPQSHAILYKFLCQGLRFISNFRWRRRLCLRIRSSIWQLVPDILVYLPKASRLTSHSGKPASRILCWVFGISYGMRWRVTVSASLS